MSHFYLRGIPSTAAAALIAMAAGRPSLRAEDPSPVIRAGQAQFAQTCGFCHGADASGGTEGPNLMRSALVRHDKNGDLIGPIIRDGRPGTKMPAFPLDDSQIAGIVAYLHLRLKQSDRASPGRPGDYDLKLLLTGNVAAGKAFFYGAGACSRCHSPAGDLRGIAAKYAPADLESRFLYPSGVRKTTTITTPSSEHVVGELFFRDQFTIAIKDKDGWYHSWPLSKVKAQIDDPAAGHLDLLRRYTDADVHDLFAYLETLK